MDRDLTLILKLQDQMSKDLKKVSDSIGSVGTQSGIAGKSLRDAFDGIGNRFSLEFGLISKAAKLATAGVIAVGAGAVAFGISSVQAFAAAEASQTRFEHALKQIANASDSEVVALRKQQDALSLTTRFEDDAIASAQGFLGTFQLNAKQITLMTPRLLDMAEGLRDNTGASIGLEQASNMLGKALQLGTVGMLAKAGVTIPGTTKAMQDLFKAKFEVATLEQRTLMLAELVDGNFKGQAVSAGTTLAGQLDILSHAYENVQESIGGALAEGLKPFAMAITSFVTGDEMKQYVADLTVRIKAWVEAVGGPAGIKQKFVELKDKIINEVIPAVLSVIDKVVTATKFIWEHRDAILAVIVAWELFKVAISIVDIITATTTAITAMGGAAGIFGGIIAVITSPITIWIAIIMAVIAAGYLLWKNWDFIKQKAIEIWGSITSFISWVWETAKTTIINTVNSIGDGIVSAWNGIINYFQTQLLQDIGVALGFVVGLFIALPMLFANAVGALGDFLWNNVFVPAWNFLAENIPKWMDAMIKFFVDLPQNIISGIGNLGDSIWNGVMVPAWNFLSENIPKWIDSILQFFKDLPQNIFNALGGLGQKIGDAFKNAFEWVKNNWSTFTKGFGEGFQKALDLAGLKFAVGGIVPQHLATGGFAGSGTDTIPAMLTPGEMVLNAGQQSRMFNMLNGRGSGTMAGAGANIIINMAGGYFLDRNAGEMLAESLSETLRRKLRL